MADINVASTGGAQAVVPEETQINTATVDSETSQRMNQLLSERREGKPPQEMTEEELRSAIEQNRSDHGQQQALISDLRTQLKDPSVPMDIKMDLTRQLQGADKRELEIAMHGTELKHHLDVKTGVTNPTPPPSSETAELHRIERRLDLVSDNIQGLQKQINSTMMQRANPDTPDQVRSTLDNVIDESKLQLQGFLEEQTRLQGARADAAAAGGVPLARPADMSPDEITREISHISGELRRNGDELVSVMNSLGAAETPEADKAGLQSQMSDLIAERGALLNRGRDLQSAQEQSSTSGSGVMGQTTSGNAAVPINTANDISPVPGSGSPPPYEMGEMELRMAIAQNDSTISNKRGELHDLQNQLQTGDLNAQESVDLQRRIMETQQEIQELSIHGSQLQSALENTEGPSGQTVTGAPINGASGSGSPPNYDQLGEVELRMSIAQNDFAMAAKRSELQDLQNQLQNEDLTAEESADVQSRIMETQQDIQELAIENSGFENELEERGLPLNATVAPTPPSQMTQTQLATEIDAISKNRETISARMDELRTMLENPDEASSTVEEIERELAALERADSTLAARSAELEAHYVPPPPPPPPPQDPSTMSEKDIIMELHENNSKQMDCMFQMMMGSMMNMMGGGGMGGMGGMGSMGTPMMPDMAPMEDMIDLKKRAGELMQHLDAGTHL
ncbi:MAG: hypothetical protein AAGC81_07410 [Pseudomonadota bacterium]